MDSASDIKTDDTHAAEVGIVTFEGREFASGGFSIDLERGRMLAYVGKGEPFQHRSGHVTSYNLQTWGGEHLAPIVRTDSHLPACGDSCRCLRGPRGFCNITGRPTALYSFLTLEPIAGFHWYGRGLGAGMCIKMRRGRKA
jgi:hypothetical protein